MKPEIQELIDAAREFVVRVERGEIRSSHTYTRFVVALEAIDAENAPSSKESNAELSTLNTRGSQ